MNKRAKKGSRYTPKARRCFICRDEMDAPEAPPEGVEVSGWVHRTCVEDLMAEMRDECPICQEEDPHQHLSHFA